VFDSANAAGGLALLAIAAGEAAQRGDDVGSILAMLEPVRARTLTWAMTRDLTMAVRGGRVPAWGKWLVQGLGLTPVAKVTPAGKLSLAGGLVGRRHVPERFARYVARRVDRTQRWRVIVGHCDAAADGEMLLAALRRELDCAQSWLVETGPAVGAHAGPGALVASLQPA
jgi:DegV family protein with EDD domain